MDPDDSDAARCPLHFIGQLAIRRERQLVLRNLISLRQVGIEVILPRENRRLVDAAAECDSGPRRELDDTSVQDRKRTWQPEADGTDVGVGRTAELRAAAAEN